jgi:hypothetical protein
MTGKIGLLGLLLLAAFILGNFYFQLTGGPSRTQSARLDPYGDINVHLETQPDPPKMGGIPLILHITDQNGKRVAVDQVQYDYVFQDRTPQTLKGESMGMGTYQAIAGLTDVGEWQIRVTLIKGSQQTQVKFILRVGANI